MRAPLCVVLLLVACAEEREREPETLATVMGRKLFDAGMDHARNGRHAEAIAAYREAAGLMRSSPQVHYNLGNAYFSSGMLDEATGAYRRARELKPDYVEAYYQLGGVFIRLKKYDEAVRQLAEAVRLHPGHVPSYNALGLLQTRRGNYDEAVAFEFPRGVSEKGFDRVVGRPPTRT